jgi:hypothetical protein
VALLGSLAGAVHAVTQPPAQSQRTGPRWYRVAPRRDAARVMPVVTMAVTLSGVGARTLW